MVYSCGGFSRCFRIARFYDLEGPPVGVEYSKPGEGDDRRAASKDAYDPDKYRGADASRMQGAGRIMSSS